ncbi:MAG: plasmid replication DNA-binding protein [Chryseobacterium sp.]|jgi:cell division protein FtsN|uniref:Plasmid replication DNA-binding protein n=1 Tax=Acinetobacter johnsonii TaxID=40214 RepID=A0AA42SFM2_ACIJO|nr:plasmid replication DNA-binding protein [Acinetobacter johnsonii]MDH0827960.1 plasmid replication DNA-binding protein [Acinetobacter johnsonii]MDN5578738.1 plasmid replication DNA-binding protein [Chryseobacterium sp.]
MKALSVIELSQLYGMNRQSIYKRINKGDLSKNSDGKIDLSEAIRVFGEPSNKNNNVTPLQSTTVQKETEVDMLKQQVDILKKQLELAHEREVFQREQLEAKDNQIEAIQRLLEAPKTNMTTFTDQKPDQNIATDPRPEPELKHDGLTTPEQTENKRIPVPEQVEPEQPKRGWLSRFFLPNG